MPDVLAGDSGKPRYLQIADDLAQQVRAQVLKPGDKIDSESELMARYSVSQGTVRKAMTELRTTGLIETHHGKGSFVKARPPVRRKSSDRFRRSHRSAGKAAYLAEAEQAGSKPTVNVLYVGPGEAPPEIAERLSIAAGEKVLTRRRVYFSDSIATEEATSYLPWDLAKDIPELFEENPGAGGIYARIEEHGLSLQEFGETIRVRLATKRECVALGMSPGSPIIHLTRDAVAETGRVVEVCDTIMAADQFVLDYRIPATD